jgi:resolvase-like protein
MRRWYSSAVAAAIVPQLGDTKLDASRDDVGCEAHRGFLQACSSRWCSSTTQLVQLLLHLGHQLERTTLDHRHMGCEIVKVYKDHGISGTRGRDKRPAFDKRCRGATRREFNMVMAWSVDRLGRSLQDLVGFLSELHALKIDLFLRQQGLDT